MASKLNGYGTNCGEDVLEINFNNNVFLDRLELDFFEDLETYFTPDNIEFEFNSKSVFEKNINKKTYFEISEKFNLKNVNMNAIFTEKQYTKINF